MGTVAPEDPEPSATAEVTADRASPRRRWKVPTSIVVTFLGIALTAWLLPAFTRQWDDRQRAQELKVAIVADMASATSRAIAKAKRADPRTRNGAAALRQAADEWLQTSLTLEAKLRAYFPSVVVASWAVHSYFVDKVLGMSERDAWDSLKRAIKWMLAVPNTVSVFELDATARRQLPHDVALDTVYLAIAESAASKTTHPRVDTILEEVEKYARQSLTDREMADIRYAVATFGAQSSVAERSGLVLTLGADIAALVLDTNPRGYSTTGRDLVNDLLPF